MVIDVNVTGTLEFEIKVTMLCECVEHVVKESYACGYFRSELAISIQINLDVDFGLVGISLDYSPSSIGGH